MAAVPVVDPVNPCPAHAAPKMGFLTDVGHGAQMIACQTHVGGIPSADCRIFKPNWRRVPDFRQHPVHVRMVLGATRAFNKVDPDEPTCNGLQFCQKVWIPAAEGEVRASLCVSGPCQHRNKAQKSLQSISW